MIPDQNFRTIGQYFTSTELFIIPDYQRGYKWGVSDPDKEGQSAVNILLDNLISAYKKNVPEYFLQGVTVSESQDGVVLIDGQQRTTTLWLLLYLLGERECLINVEGRIRLRYDIRKETQLYLEGLIWGSDAGTATDTLQDLYYLDKAKNDILNVLPAISDKTSFAAFITNKVKILYIVIPEAKATRTFKMMNGQKAIMKPEELIKAELLRLMTAHATANKGNQADFLADEWDINAKRNKYAREWDKWLYWWNRNDVTEFFKTGGRPMGALIRYDFLLNLNAGVSEDFSFDNYKLRFLSGSEDAEKCFERIRKLQKSFEDIYNDFKTYNLLGLCLAAGTSSQYEKTVFFFQNKGKDAELERYANWLIIGCSHKEAADFDLVAYRKNSDRVSTILSDRNLYENNRHFAGLQLLRINIRLDNQLSRKFDFAIYGQKSLEHIYPKSWEDEATSQLHFSDSDNVDHSVHCIGNLVLLDRKTNSAFRALAFAGKKAKYFTTDYASWSLKLLHSVAVFSQSAWNESSIVANKTTFMDDFKKTYKL